MAVQDIAFDLIARDRASSTFDRVGRSTDTTSSKLAKFGKVAKLAALGAAAGAAIAGKVLFDWTKAAIADEAAQEKLAGQLRRTTGATDAQVASVENWIEKQGKLLGVTDDELRPAISRLVAATKDQKKAQDLAALAMDISVAKNKPLKAVTEALARAQEGNIGSLGRLGVATKDQHGKTKSLEEITRDLAKTYGGAAAEAAETTEGKFKRLNVMWDETKEKIGAKLIPIAERLADFVLKDLVPAIGRLSRWLEKNLGPAFAAIGGFIRDKVIPAAKQFRDWFVEKIAPGLKRTVTPILDGVRSMFQKISEKVDENRPALDKLQRTFKRIAEFIADKIMPVLGNLGELGFKALGKFIGGVIDLVADLIEAMDKIIGKVKDVVNAIKNIPKPDINLPDLNPFNRSTSAGWGSAQSASQPLTISVPLYLDSRQVYEGQVTLYRMSGGQLGLAG